MKESEKWNERYKDESYAYGINPNEYLKEQLSNIEGKTILFPAEGEGRNAVFAAKKGWEVHAFDISIEGQKKALQLASENNVTIDYQVGLIEELKYNEEQFDVIALIYAHFPASYKSLYHKVISKYLRKGGYLIFEAFSKKHIDYVTRNPKVGGPKDIDDLFSVDEIKSDFANFEIIELEEKEIDLKEGLYHNGKASVIRFVGRKK